MLVMAQKRIRSRANGDGALHQPRVPQPRVQLRGLRKCWAWCSGGCCSHGKGYASLSAKFDCWCSTAKVASGGTRWWPSNAGKGVVASGRFLIDSRAILLIQPFLPPACLHQTGAAHLLEPVRHRCYVHGPLGSISWLAPVLARVVPKALAPTWGALLRGVAGRVRVMMAACPKAEARGTRAGRRNCWAASSAGGEGLAAVPLRRPSLGFPRRRLDRLPLPPNSKSTWYPIHGAHPTHTWDGWLIMGAQESWPLRRRLALDARKKSRLTAGKFVRANQELHPASPAPGLTSAWLTSPLPIMKLDSVFCGRHTMRCRPVHPKARR